MTPMNTPAAEAVVRVEVHRFGAFLSTRSTGAKIRDELELAVRSARAQEIEIDFSGVEAVTISFADEFIGRLMSARAAGDLGDPTVVVVGLNDEVEEALSICLERRGAVAVAHDEEGLRLLGGDAIAARTFDAAVARGTFRATDLAADLSITPQNVNNRLKHLTASGALQRKKDAPQTGGREFLYVAPPSKRSRSTAPTSSSTSLGRRERTGENSASRSGTGRRSAGRSARRGLARN